MKTTTRKLLLGAALTLFAANAHAILTVQISENADFSAAMSVADGDASDITAAAGVVTLAGSLGTWFANVSTGATYNTGSVDVLDLNSVNLSGGVGTIYIRLSDTGFSKLDTGFMTSFGGTTNGTVSFQSYVDATNTLFGTGTLLSDSGLLSCIHVGCPGTNDSGSINMVGPYSMSIYAAITHGININATSFDYSVTVPEPATLALMGLGLVGLGFAGRRKV